MEIMIKLVNCDEGKYPRIAKYLAKIRGEYPEYNKIFVENIAGHMKFFESCFEKPMENFLTKGEQLKSQKYKACESNELIKCEKTLPQL